MKAKDIEQRQCNRFVVLYELYNACNADITQNIDVAELAYRKGIKNGKFKEAFNFLSYEKLLTSTGNSVASITHEGVKIVEYVILHPIERTNLFPSFNDMGI